MAHYQLIDGIPTLSDDDSYCSVDKDQFVQDFLTDNPLVEDYSNEGAGFIVEYKFTNQKVYLLYKSLSNGTVNSIEDKRIRLSDMKMDPSLRYFFVAGYNAHDTRLYFVTLNGAEQYIPGANSSSYWFYWNEIVKTYNDGCNIWVYDTSKSGPNSIIGANLGNLGILHNSIIAYSKYQMAQNALVNFSTDASFHQTIFYGSPGTGKSHAVKEYTIGTKVHRTTFHPDTDYSAFVGSFKPFTEEVNGKKQISYKFSPQTFTNAYLEAWDKQIKNESGHISLVIEELNRGNCAQIFGDLFQLLDRGQKGFSEYSIVTDIEFSRYIKEHFDSLGNDAFEKYYNCIRDNSDLTDKDEKTISTYDNSGKNDVRLCLPPNLSIVCTMNTSDQSLFPMDSAFKRRWDWEYVPIDYGNNASDFKIIIDDTHIYNWLEFLKNINDRIYSKTLSEDKQMGNFFVKDDELNVDVDQFVSKVMYYLWSEICKDNPKAKKEIFQYKEGEDIKDFYFSSLFSDKKVEILIGFMSYLGLTNEYCGIIEENEDAVDATTGSADEWVLTTYMKCMTKYLDNSQEKFAIDFKNIYMSHTTPTKNEVIYRSPIDKFCIRFSRNKRVNKVTLLGGDKLNEIINNNKEPLKDLFGIAEPDSTSIYVSKFANGQIVLASNRLVETIEEYKWFTKTALDVVEKIRQYTL